MASGDYYLQKNNGTTIDEKIFTAVADKAIGFDASLNPVMLDLPSTTSINNWNAASNAIFGGVRSNNCLIKWIDSSNCFTASQFVENDDTSIAIGTFSTAEGQSSFALGGDTTAMGGATAIGQNSYADGSGAVAIGGSAVAIGIGALALGGSADAEADYSIAIGLSSQAYGFGSVALGNSNSVREQYSYAFGQANETWGAGDIVIGHYGKVHSTSMSSMMLAVGINYNGPSLTQDNTLAIIGEYNATTPIPFYVAINKVTATRTLDVNGNIGCDSLLVDVATGSAPIVVNSLTTCTNLNADLLDGNHASAFSLSGHTHTYDNFVSWDISANSGTASQIYKSGSASSYKGVNFVGSGNVSVSTNSNANGFINVNISGSSSYSHPTYTVFNPTLTGALVLASLTTDAIGSVTAATTRTLTLANLGYTGATNATYFTGHTIYLNGASLVTIGSGGYLNVVATNAAGDPVVTLTGNAGAFRYDISVSGIPNCTLTGYTEGSTGALGATDTLKTAFSKLSATVPIVFNVTADITTSSLTAVPVFTTGTLPAGTYIIDVAILASSSTSAGCRYSISNTGTATGYCTAQGAITNLVTYAQEAFNINTLSSQYYAVGPSSLASVTITAIVVLTTSGTISFNHSKHISGTGTVKAHSYMRIQRKQ